MEEEGSHDDKEGGGYLTERDPLEVHSVVGVEGVPPGQLLVLDVQLAVLLDQPGPSLRNLRRHLGLILLSEAIHRCSYDNKGFLLVLFVFSFIIFRICLSEKRIFQ